jgi:hypothetical protein
MLNKLKSEAYSRGLTDVKPQTNDNSVVAQPTQPTKSIATVSTLSSKEELIAFIRTQTDSARSIKAKLTSWHFIHVYMYLYFC